MSKILVDGKDQDKEHGLIAKTLGVLFGWVRIKKVFDKEGVYIVDKNIYKVEAANDINECSKEIHSSGGQVLVARAVTPLGVKETLSKSEIKERLKKIAKNNNKDLYKEAEKEEKEALAKREAEVEKAYKIALEAKKEALAIKEKAVADKVADALAKVVEEDAIKELERLAHLEANEKGDK